MYLLPSKLSSLEYFENEFNIIPAHPFEGGGFADRIEVRQDELHAALA